MALLEEGGAEESDKSVTLDLGIVFQAPHEV